MLRSRKLLRIGGRLIPGSSGVGVGHLSIPIWYDPALDIDCCVGAYQSVGVPSYAASMINLASPGTYDLTEGVAPGWSHANGWEFRVALGSYLSTGITPDANYSYIVRFTGLDIADVNSIFGAYGNLGEAGPDRIDIWPDPNISGDMVWWYGDGSATSAPRIAQGVFGIAGNVPYREGAPLAPIVQTGWTGACTPVYLGAVNDNNTGPIYISDVNIQAFAIYSCQLTDAQMLAISEAAAML